MHYILCTVQRKQQIQRENQLQDYAADWTFRLQFQQKISLADLESRPLRAAPNASSSP